jgi:hypothetical protein
MTIKKTQLHKFIYLSNVVYTCQQEKKKKRMKL